MDVTPTVNPPSSQLNVDRHRKNYLNLTAIVNNLQTAPSTPHTEHTLSISQSREQKVYYSIGLFEVYWKGHRANVKPGPFDSHPCHILEPS